MPGRVCCEVPKEAFSIRVPIDLPLTRVEFDELQETLATTLEFISPWLSKTVNRDPTGVCEALEDARESLKFLLIPNHRI